MPVETGTKAPQFSLPDAEGASFRFDDALARGPVVVGLYKSSCQASKTMFPFLERIFRGYPTDRLTVWGVSQDSPNVTKSFARRYGITFPILIDLDDYAVSRAFDILATPTVFVIDPSGAVVWQVMGFQKPAMDELSAKVAELLGVEPVDITTGTDDVSPWVPG